MKKLLLIGFLLITCVELLTCEQTTTPTTVSTTQGASFQYSLPILGISDSTLNFENYRNETWLLFYFNPSCPHCQASFSKVQALVDSLTPYGLHSLALAVSSADSQTIQNFALTYAVHIPLAQDTSGMFESTYGSGFVPLYMVIHANGTYTRYPENTDSTLPAIRAELLNILR